MTIEELMYYGRYYSFESKGYHLWWFDLQKANVYQYDELIQKFGYSSQEEIVSSGMFVPLFETDIVKLEHEFLLLRNYKQIKRLEKQLNSDFDTEFKVFIEKNDLIKSWHDFEYNRLYQDAIVWCRENHIRNIVIK